MQYALPYECVPTLMFVNKTLLEAEGIPVPENDWTWEDFYSICAQVTRDTDGSGTIDQFGSYGYTWLDALAANGAALFDEDGQPLPDRRAARDGGGRVCAAAGAVI